MSPCSPGESTEHLAVRSNTRQSGTTLPDTIDHCGTVHCALASLTCRQTVPLQVHGKPSCAIRHAAANELSDLLTIHQRVSFFFFSLSSNRFSSLSSNLTIPHTHTRQRRVLSFVRAHLALLACVAASRRVIRSPLYLSCPVSHLSASRIVTSSASSSPTRPSRCGSLSHPIRRFLESARVDHAAPRPLLVSLVQVEQLLRSLVAVSRLSCERASSSTSAGRAADNASSRPVTDQCASERYSTCRSCSTRQMS